MKTKFKILIAAILFALNTTFALAQETVDLSCLTENVTLGDNCSSNGDVVTIYTTGDVNLNGYRLKLKNVNLVIVGNLYDEACESNSDSNNGGSGDRHDDEGEIKTCGNSTFCVQGNVYGNVDYNQNDLDCSTLSLDDSEYISLTYSIRNKVLIVNDVDVLSIFDMNGRIITRTNGNQLSLNFLRNGTYIIVGEKEGKSGVFKLAL